MIAATGFLTEYFWPAGDLRWAYVLVAGTIAIPLLYSPDIIMGLRKITSPRVQTAASVGNVSAPYPQSTKWLSPADVYQILVNSTLVTRIVELDIKSDSYADRLHFERRRAGELADFHMLEFRRECPDAVRDGKYGHEALAWWIGQKIEEREGLSP